jgi:hypothetical protein
VPEILIAELEGYPIQEIEAALAQMVIEKNIADAQTKLELDKTFQDACEVSECFER